VLGQQPPDGNNNNHVGEVPPRIIVLLDNEEEEGRWIEREEREGDELIKRTVNCDKVVPEDNFVLIPVISLCRHGGAASLTCRRICFAVLAVVTAGLLHLHHGANITLANPRSGPIFDELLPKLLHVRDISLLRARYCHDLHRDFFQNILLGSASPIDCSLDGV
jgi:hypothetical protein